MKISRILRHATVAIHFALLASTGQSAPANKETKTEAAPVPIHDPADHLFRRAPMAAATKSVVIPLATNVHLAFDAELLRTHVAWTGTSLNLFGPPYHGSSDRFICDFDGKPLWTTPQVYPWSAGEMLLKLSQEKPAASRFLGVSTRSDKTTVMYEIGLQDATAVRVHETPFLWPRGDHPFVVRRFEVAPSPEDLFVLVHADVGKFVSGSQEIAVLEREKDRLLVALRRGGPASLVSTNVEVQYMEVQNVEVNGRGPRMERQTNQISRTEARIYVKIPRRDEAIAFEINSAVFAKTVDLAPVQFNLLNGLLPNADLSSATNKTETPGPVAAKEFAADKTALPRLDGDKFYKVEHFPVPKEMDLRVTGMDFLSNGDLAVCTWAGEIYFVRKAQKDVRTATYHRFARGLMEPMGLKVVNGDIYVIQKCELTRISDKNADGEADLFETITSGWDFTGRYNAFANGPVIDRNGDFYVFVGGNGAFWDARYMGWGMKISRDGRTLTPFCSGLRVPHGVEMIGEDIFMAENQGHWIGACKLNHLQAGKFYGYPSAWPAPYEQYEKTTNFTPPAVWFPYTLAKSASGMVSIPDDRLGPFKGQLIVADFQLSVLTRVMLEKVNGEWQGAVWPFAKGFLSGLNRVAIGPDGKLYAGGGKGGHWSGAVGPQMYSLDRLSFTGKTPFEVKEVHAMPDGFELTFTQPVDAEACGKADAFDVAQYTYKYHGTYGSPEIDHNGKENSSTDIKVVGAVVSGDRLKVLLTLEGLRPGYVTMVRGLDVVNEEGEYLRNDTFWYTLNSIPSVATAR
jgi:glucose/arabinose dehydrogenase